MLNENNLGKLLAGMRRDSGITPASSGETCARAQLLTTSLFTLLSCDLLLKSKTVRCFVYNFIFNLIYDQLLKCFYAVSYLQVVLGK